MSTEISTENTYAAIDLGSNSFHMAVAGATSTHLQMIDKLRRPVRLGSGLDKNNNITPDTMDRALRCLEIFQHRLRGVPVKQIRTVGTNTLRRACNAREFNEQAEAILGAPIDIISGREEARLIYTGVVYGRHDNAKRLVVDIGGGSTELIIGTGINPVVMESVNMGCVSATQKWFGDNDNIGKQFEKSIKKSQLELRALTDQYQRAGWESCIGSSGTIKAVERILVALELTKQGISIDGLEEIRKLLAKKGMSALSGISISDDRKAVILGGLSVLIATFRSLKIEFMNVSHSALREGVIVDLAGKKLNEHVRQNAISDIQRRFQIDKEQAARVSVTADIIFGSVSKAWELSNSQHRAVLRHACALHEIGRSVAHVQYHKHGEYLLTHADMLGFSRNDQNMLARLVRYHRRKVASNAANRLSANHKDKYHHLLIILRLAVLFHRTRTASDAPPLTLSVTAASLIITVPHQWLSDNPLTHADLINEIGPAKTAGFTLAIHASSINKD